ncbi:MAG: hypothetical protein WBQ43_12140 [Terriglobales bacterium]
MPAGYAAIKAQASGGEQAMIHEAIQVVLGLPLFLRNINWRRSNDYAILKPEPGKNGNRNSPSFAGMAELADAAGSKSFLGQSERW